MCQTIQFKSLEDAKSLFKQVIGQFSQPIAVGVTYATLQGSVDINELNIDSNLDSDDIQQQMVRVNDHKISFKYFIQQLVCYVLTEHCVDECFNDEDSQSSYGTFICDVSGAFEISHDDVSITNHIFVR